MRYVGKSSFYDHIDYCVVVWNKYLIIEEEWINRFFHTLETVPINYYVYQELRHSIRTWTRLVEIFLDTFNFESKYFLVDCALQWIKDIIFQPTHESSV